MRTRWVAVCGALTQAGAGAAGAQGERHVCRLLKASEVAAFVGPAVALANVVEDEPERSTCHYEDKDGVPLFILTVYWKGGKSQWNASRAAQIAGDRMLADAEGSLVSGRRSVSGARFPPGRSSSPRQLRCE